MQYKCKHFKIYELVDPDTYGLRGERAWELLDNRLLITLDALRVKFGKMTINNYKFGGERKWSGLRTPDSPWYSTYSQHTYGRAADIIFEDYTADQIRKQILDNPDSPAYDYITAMEEDTSWVHIDMRNTTRIKTFKKA